MCQKSGKKLWLNNNILFHGNIPIWFLQGTADEPCPIDETRSLISELHKLGATPLATEYDGVDHDSLTMALEQEGVFEWLLANR